MAAMQQFQQLQAQKQPDSDNNFEKQIIELNRKVDVLTSRVYHLEQQRYLQYQNQARLYAPMF